MKIVITGINVTNVDNISWCLGAAGLSGMNTVVDLTKHVVEIDGSTTDAEEFGTMLLALHEYGFIVEIQQDENPPTLRVDPETCLVSGVLVLSYIVRFEQGDAGYLTGQTYGTFPFVTLAEAISKVDSCISTDCSETDAMRALATYGAAHYFDRFNSNKCVITKEWK
jgi:hypothetical protein